MINTEERTLAASLSVTLFISKVHRYAHPSFIIWCLLKNEPITLCLIDFHFRRAVCKEKNIWINLTVSQYFRPVVKMGPKPGKTSVIVK